MYLNLSFIQNREFKIPVLAMTCTAKTTSTRTRFTLGSFSLRHKKNVIKVEITVMLQTSTYIRYFEMIIQKLYLYK